MQRFGSHSAFPPAALPARLPLLCGLLLLAAASSAQVLTIDTHGNPVHSSQGATTDRRFAQIEPTHIALSDASLNPKSRLELIRFLQAEQGFAMRPLPRGHKGLTLAANGKLSPAGEPYLAMITEQGTSAKPGERVAITDVQVERDKIVLLLNGGPDPKHRFLRHIQAGNGAGMSPVVQGDNQEPVGSRLTLAFKERVPDLSGKQVEDLLAPLISFQVKSPIQAFTDTLPPALKAAILNHHVLVGMSTEMVLFTLGKPERKIREMDGQTPFEEWIYGQPPADVQFVRINGNRVIRVELAQMGKSPVIFDKDQVDGLMRTDGTPIAPERSTPIIAMGDVVKDPDRQAQAAPPSLRQPGETAPTNDPNAKREGVMKPVQFPKQAPDDHPVVHRNDPSAQQPAANPSADASKPAPPSAGDKPPANSTPAPAQTDHDHPAQSKPTPD